MKICIVGCGYVGSRAARYWRERQHIITAATRSPNRLNELETLAGQALLLSDSFNAAVKGQDAILIAVAPGPKDDYPHTYLHTAREIIKSASPHQTILYTSSTSVYGDQGGKIVTEMTPLNPLNEKAGILIETEKELLKHPKSCIFRLGEIIGPGREMKEKLQRLQGKELPGTGENPVNIIHIDDIIKALDFTLTHHLTGIYNLCSDEHTPRKKLYTDICEKEGIPLPTWNPALSSHHGGNRIVSTQKLKDAGFR